MADLVSTGIVRIGLVRDCIVRIGIVNIRRRSSQWVLERRQLCAEDLVFDAPLIPDPAQ